MKIQSYTQMHIDFYQHYLITNLFAEFVIRKLTATHRTFFDDNKYEYEKWNEVK